MWYEKEVTPGGVGTPDLFIRVFENLMHLWPDAEFQGALVRSRALDIPDRCVHLCASPGKDLNFLGGESIVGKTSLQ